MHLTNCTVLYFINKQPISYEVTKMTMTIMMVGDDDITIAITSNLSITTASYCRMLVIAVAVLEVVKREVRGISLCLHPRCSEEQLLRTCSSSM